MRLNRQPAPSLCRSHPSSLPPTNPCHSHQAAHGQHWESAVSALWCRCCEQCRCQWPRANVGVLRHTRPQRATLRRHWQAGKVALPEILGICYRILHSGVFKISSDKGLCSPMDICPYNYTHLWQRHELYAGVPWCKLPATPVSLILHSF